MLHLDQQLVSAIWICNLLILNYCHLLYKKKWYQDIQTRSLNNLSETSRKLYVSSKPCHPKFVTGFQFLLMLIKNSMVLYFLWRKLLYIEKQREITTIWKKFVMEKKKMNGVKIPIPLSLLFSPCNGKQSKEVMTSYKPLPRAWLKR